MTSHTSETIRKSLLLMTAFALLPSSVWAQAVNPFATPEPALATGVETNPSIIALEESNPSSPEQLMFAIQVANGFDRLDVVGKYGERIVAAAASDEAKVALHQRFGSPLFLKLSDRHRFGDELSEFAQSVIAAASANARQADRLRQFAIGAQADDELTRRAAFVELLKAGKDAAPILLNAISQASTDVQRGRLETALVALQREAVRPMIAALESDNAAVVEHSAQALGRLDAKEAIPYLVGLAMSKDHPGAAASRRALMKMVGVEPTLPEAVLLLRRKIDAIRAGDLPARPEIDDTIRVYRWDNDLNSTVALSAPREVARYDAAARLSRDLAKLSNRHVDQLGALLVQLQDAQLKTGLDQTLDRNSPFWKSKLQLNPKFLEEALVEAIRRKWSPAATAAIEMLGESGEVTLLDSSDGRPRPLATALTHPDRRLRYAATRAIMKLNPDGAFAGSSSLIDSLEFFIRATGRRRVLVAHPNISGAQTIVGLLQGQDYDGLAATSGRNAIQLAQQNPDIEFILLSGMLDGPSVGETITLLRQDPRTSGLVIGVMARENIFQDVLELANEDPLTVAMPRLHSVSAASVHTARIQSLMVDNPSQATRIVQAQAALRILKTIAADRKRYGFYEVFRCEESLINAAQRPVLTEDAARVLALLGTERAQRVLMLLSLAQGLEGSLRLSVFQAFREAVALRGLQLRNSEIRDQIRQLKNSPLNDALSKQIAAAILNVFKGKPVDTDALQAAASS